MFTNLFGKTTEEEQKKDMKSMTLLISIHRTTKLILLETQQWLHMRLQMPEVASNTGMKNLGGVWIKRLCSHFTSVAWLNPIQDDHWDYTSSVCILRDLVEKRMFPLTLKGLEDAMKSNLSK